MTLTLLSAIRSARILHKDNPQLTLSGGMVIVQPHLKQIALRKSIEIGGPSSVLVARTQTVSEGALHSYILFRKTTAVILLHSSANTCWSRFSIAKELLHIYTGCPHNGESIPDRLRLAHSSRFNLPAQDNAPIDDETYCFYMALELLLPWSHRMALSDMKASGAPPRVMATCFMIPCQVIDHFFEGGYAERSFRINSALDI